MASYYVVYIASAIPAVGVGALTVATDLSAAGQAFAYAVIIICLAGLAGPAHRATRSAAPRQA